MGAYSQLDAERWCDAAFEEDESLEVEENSAIVSEEKPETVLDTVSQPKQVQEISPVQPTTDKAEDDDPKRKAHEESEAKRKAEFDARQQAKKAGVQEQLDRLNAMTDDEVMAAALKRVGADTEKLTRRNMKECVAEHVQTLCLADPAFARRVQHPGKSMIHCIWYINRKAREFVEQEMKDNDLKPGNGVYGSDVPDDLCYQWAEDYFNDLDAEEDREDEEEFVPRPYYGGTAKSKSKTKEKKAAAPKKAEVKKPEPQPVETSGQLSLGDFAIPEEKAG